MKNRNNPLYCVDRWSDYPNEWIIRLDYLYADQSSNQLD